MTPEERRALFRRWLNEYFPAHNKPGPGPRAPGLAEAGAFLGIAKRTVTAKRDGGALVTLRDLKLIQRYGK